MKKLFYVLICALVLTACAGDEDLVPASQSGRKALLKLAIDVPVAKTIETRAISEQESVVNELMLIMFDGSTKQVVNLTDSTTLVSTDNNVANGYRSYSLQEAVPVASGNWKVYAVANWSSLFANLTADDLAAMSESQLKQVQMFNSEQYFQSGDKYLPMSGYLASMPIDPAEEASQATEVKLSLRRAVSHIEVEFKNGTTENKPNFQPETYAIYNLPKTAGLMHDSEVAGLSDVELVQATDYFNVTNQAVSGNGVIEFLMLENVKTAKQTTGGDYKKRDLLNESKTAFEYAPEHATFLRVSGAYEDDDVRGSISFLIHLGDFGSSGSVDDKKDNYAVKRNEHHKYTITINGMNDLIAEAKKDGETPGVSGELTSKGSNVFVLDAHYETVMLKIPKAHIDGSHTYVQDGQTVTMTNEVQIFSPKHPDGVVISLAGETAPEGDYGWIQFQKPYNTTSFPIYGKTEDGVKQIDNPDAKILGTIYDFCKNPADYGLLVTEDKQYYYTTAFVDEYVYEDLPLSDFVNVSNRVFILNPHPIHTSLDDDSIFKADCTLQLNQRSIKSTYRLDGSVANPFGIETWDETGEKEYGIDHQTDHDGTREDGWANTNSSAFRAEGKSAPLTSAGYLSSVADNSKASHIWTNAGDFANAIQAVYARNRDVDSSEVIEADELKWYMPALQQYLTIWLGQDLLYEDTKLITEDEVKAQTATVMDQAAKFFTSSGKATERVYWQDQGCCWSATGQRWQGDRKANNVRCVRNLGSQGLINTESVIQATPTFPAAITTNDAGNYVISVSGVQNIRPSFFSGYYPEHTERSDYNLLPMAFEVAPADETDEDGNTLYHNAAVQIHNEINTIYAEPEEVLAAFNAAADEYNTKVDNSGTKWRVPNQRELMLMALLDGVFPYQLYTSQPAFVSSTFYTCYKDAGYEGRTQYTFSYATSNKNYPLLNYTQYMFGSLRFVRDVATEQASSESDEGELENGGTGFGIDEN